MLSSFILIGGVLDLFKISRSEGYLHNRAIFDGDFYYASNFKEFANELKPHSFESTKYG